MIGIIIVAASAFLLVIILSICLFQRRRERHKLAIFIKNPLVISIAIGKYDKIPSESEIDDTMFCNLEGIENDIKNMYKLFRESLKYGMIPNYDMNEKIKVHWTKQEIINLLKRSGKYLDENIKNSRHAYDGLIVTVSSHGIQDHIVTSDYKKINKDTIHRIFSVDFPSLRHIPGIFMYDCCDGENKMIKDQHRNDMSRDSQKPLNKGGAGSGTELDDVNGEEEVKTAGGLGMLYRSRTHETVLAYGTDEKIWFKGEPNPDYKLVVISSSNKGFASQMGSRSGSFMIRQFTEKMQGNIHGIGRRKKLFLFEIFHEIQDELHDDLGKQLIEAKYNNKLEYVKFMRNGMDQADDVNYAKLASISEIRYVNDDFKDIRIESSTHRSLSYDINDEQIDNLMDVVDEMDADMMDEEDDSTHL